MLPRQLSPLLFTAAGVGERARAISQALVLFLLSVNPHLHPHQTLLHMTQCLSLATCKLESCLLGYSERGSLKNILLASRAANPMCHSPAGADRHFSVQVAQLHPQCFHCHLTFRARVPWKLLIPSLGLGTCLSSADGRLAVPPPAWGHSAKQLLLLIRHHREYQATQLSWPSSENTHP